MLAGQIGDLVWHEKVSIPYPVSIRGSSEILTNLLGYFQFNLHAKPLLCLGLNDTDKKNKFKPRRIMCKHCISVDDFWLNNTVKSYNTRINKKYSVRF